MTDFAAVMGGHFTSRLVIVGMRKTRRKHLAECNSSETTHQN